MGNEQTQPWWCDANCCKEAIGAQGFTISEKAAHRISQGQGDWGDKNKEPEWSISMRMANALDDYWLNKMKCIQEEHSKRMGITLEQINMLADSLEKRIKFKYNSGEDEEQKLIECIRNKKHLSCCQPELQNYLDMVRTKREDAVFRQRKAFDFYETLKRLTR